MLNHHDHLPADCEPRGAPAGLGSPAPWQQDRAGSLADLFDTTSDLIQIFEVNGTLRLVNRAWCESLGYSPQEAIGMNVFNLIAPDCREQCQQVLGMLLGGKSMQLIECAFINRNGQRLSLEGQVNVVFTDGVPVEVRGIFRDVSERKAAQQELQRMNAYLESLVKQRTRELQSAQERLEEAQHLASVGHWEMDLVTGELFWSDEICRICGLDPATTTPCYADFIKMVHPDDRGRLEAGYQQLLETRQPVHLKFRLLRSDGSLRYIDARWIAIFDDDGKPLRSIGTSQDITDYEDSQRELRQSEAMLRSLFDSSSHGLVLIQDGEHFCLANSAFERISGLTSEAIQLASTGASLPKPLHDLLRLSHDVQSSRPTAQAISQWQLPDGRSAVVQMQASRVASHGHGAKGTLVWLQVEDISDRLAAEESMRLAAKVFHSAAEGIFLTDADGVIVDVNAALCRITGYQRDQILGQTPRLFKSGVHSADFYQQIWAELERQGTWSGEIVNRASDGAAQDMLETISVVRDEHGSITHYAALLTDIRQMKMQQRELERLALHDSLTGLPNRVQLAQQLERCMSALGSPDRSLAVCYLDLDGFKEINDSFGHAAGDHLLQTLAKRMQDIIGADDLIARLGGDEFVVIHHGTKAGQQELPLLQDLLDAIIKPVSWNALSLTVTVSIGVAFYSSDSSIEAADQLLRLADQAMYEAKKRGKNCSFIGHD